jgi:GNAT superfamily N-acetyltransferase
MEILHRLPSGEEIGKMVFEVCPDFESLRKQYKFEPSGYRHGFRVLRLQEYLAEAGVEEEYPMAFAKELEVDKGFRDNGHGSDLLKVFEAKAIRLGCKLALGQLGYFETETSSWENERSKNIHFYKKNGWILSSPMEDKHAFVIKALA